MIFLSNNHWAIEDNKAKANDKILLHLSAAAALDVAKIDKIGNKSDKIRTFADNRNFSIVLWKINGFKFSLNLQIKSIKIISNTAIIKQIEKTRKRKNSI